MTKKIRILLADDHAGVEALLRGTPGVTGVVKTDGQPRYHLSFNRDQTDTNALLRAVIESGCRIVGFQEDVRHLNQAFMDLTDPGVAPLALQAIPVAAPPAEPAP